MIKHALVHGGEVPASDPGHGLTCPQEEIARGPVSDPGESRPIAFGTPAIQRGMPPDRARCRLPEAKSFLLRQPGHPPGKGPEACCFPATSRRVTTEESVIYQSLTCCFLGSPQWGIDTGFRRAYIHNHMDPVTALSNGLTEAKDSSRELTDLQKAIVEAVLVDPKATGREIAENLGCHFTTVYQTLQKQHVRAHLLAEMDARLLLAAAEALNTQRSLLRTKSSYVRHQAACDLLDRAEVGAKGVGSPAGVVQVNIDLS